jgi:transcriptional regulator GlxA family with amidase domain
MNSKPALALLVLAVAGRLAAAESPSSYTKNVAIVLYEGVEILDFAGPAEVFAQASGYGANGQERAFNVYTVSKTKAPLVSQGFIDVTPDYSIADCPPPDILVLPGGGSQNVIRDEQWMDWVRKESARCDHVLTVCTGAFIAGKAGLLEGAEVTTWYNAVPRLAEQFPNAKVHPGRRLVDNGKLVTTAGVSAGIDGSLHLVAVLLGRYVADRTAEYMEYKWAPESYLSAHYTQLNPRLDQRGRTLQQAAIIAREGDLEGASTMYRSLIAARKTDAEAWLGLGRTLHDQKNYKEAVAAHLEAAKAEPQRGRAMYNLACEYALLGESDKAIDAATKAIDAGYRTKWFYENDADLVAIRQDPRFQALLARL